MKSLLPRYSLGAQGQGQAPGGGPHAPLSPPPLDAQAAPGQGLPGAVAWVPLLAAMGLPLRPALGPHVLSQVDRVLLYLTAQLKLSAEVLRLLPEQAGGGEAAGLQAELERIIQVGVGRAEQGGLGVYGKWGV